MRTLKAAIFAFAACAALPAYAQDIDMSAIKCKDFLAGSKEDISAILAWLEGYYTKPIDKPVLSPTKMAADAKALAEYCKAHGDEGLIATADKVMPRK